MTSCLRGMLAATTALWLVSAGSAAAQDAEPVDQGGTDIVVTAQKREERLLDVPAAISVVGGKRLEEFKSSQLADIAAYVPGLQIDGSGTPGQTVVSLRGIAPLGSSATTSTYIDEAPVGSSSLYARSSSFTADLLPYDIDRVEVLKGPQGTLYGASSIGGLLKYVTKTPDLDMLEARAGADIFTIAHSGGGVGYNGRVGLNLPIVTDTLAIRGSYTYQHTPGYIDNVATGAKNVNKFNQQSARMALLWKATESFSLKLSGMWQSIDAKNNGVAISELPAVYKDLNDPSATRPVPPSVARPIGDGRAQDYLVPEYFKKNIYFFTATADLDLGFADLTSASSYSRSKTRQGTDLTRILDNGYHAIFDLNLDLKKFTQELRLTSQGKGPFKWMVGGFYTHEKSDNAQNILLLDNDNVPVPAINPATVAGLPTTYKEYAAFGQASYMFGDLFELSGGLRWAHNDQKFSVISGGLGFPEPVVKIGSSKESVLTYSVSGRLQLARRASLYARIASGYRPGGPNIAMPGVPSQVDADRLTNYELGVKADVLGGSATIEAAVFLMDWDKIQLSASNGIVTYAANAGSARSKGFELAAQVRPARGFSVGLNATYTDARLTSDAPSVNGIDGARLPYVPKFSSSVLLDYSSNVGGDWKASIGTAFRFVSDRYSLVSSDPNSVKSADYAALDVNVGLTNDRWTVRLFAKNLTDGRGVLSSGMILNPVVVNNVVALKRVAVAETLIQPRTIGLSVDMKF